MQPHICGKTSCLRKHMGYALVMHGTGRNFAWKHSFKIVVLRLMAAFLQQHYGVKGIGASVKILRLIRPGDGR